MQISSTLFSMLFTITILFCSTIRICHARDTITKATPLNDDGEKIISAGNIFELGFFTGLTTLKESKQYVGIWYHSQPQTIVWVYPDQPTLPKSKGVFAIGEDGNLKLVLVDKFSTSISTRSSNTTAKLLDSGNLVLIDDQSGKYLWQSFEHPTDTFLPGMRMTDTLELTSWAAEGVYETGNYKFKREGKQYVIAKPDDANENHWRTEEPNDIPPFVASLLTSFTSKPVIPSTNSTSNTIKFNKTTYSFNKISPFPRLVLNPVGVLQFYRNISDNMTWSEPKQPCDVFNACGSNGICKPKGEQEKECNCPEGFKETVSADWQFGCTRKTKLCNSTRSRDTFLPNVKLVLGKLILDVSDNEANCSKYCHKTCECQAYSFSDNNGSKYGSNNGDKSGCRIWKQDLIHLREGILDGIKLTVRIAVSDLDSAFQPNSTTSNEPKPQNSSQIKHRVLIISITVIAAIVICILSYLFYIRLIAKNRRARIYRINSGSLQPMVFIPASHDTDMTVRNIRKSIDVSFFKFQTILDATDNFAEANKLGEGGFGPVYKGVFAGEEYLAVKRLSSSSGQGVEEFQNEVALIAKLQHRNLVRVLGYCVEKDERVLLYEYMPNKSLDKFLFNQRLSFLLDWSKRFDIIFGVARGLLYLHQDSRLRIIHRDLKISNILLDEEMNAKISDFGLARIVQGSQTEANTNRVVGTYGYMSPEYALEGLFSIKSDVYSFGVIVLEIISGKRNTGFNQSREAINLLGYAWKLWEAKKPLYLLDEKLEWRCNQTEVAKCVNIGLLCVQEDPGDRPTMANVVTMLSTESIAIPAPSQPAYIERRSLPSTSSSSSMYRETPSFNKLTLTVQEGR